MEESKIGDNDALLLDPTSLRTQNRVTSSTLQKAKESAINARASIHHVKPTSRKLVVRLNATAVPTGTPRMLSKAEIDELRKTKQSIALHMHELYRA
ncbi:MAG: hypothetical protein ACXWIN_05280 [Burkholderiaceae bacterium]